MTEEATKPTRPVDPGPSATPAERHAFAEATRDWEEWLKDHPEDADQATGGDEGTTETADEPRE